MKETLTLTLTGIVRREIGNAPNSDRRRRVNMVLAEYRGSDGEAYRKSFRSYGEPTVPSSGTHKTINAMADQY